MVVFFFLQKTAYDMRISDWSSDVCSSDLDLLSIRRIAKDDDSALKDFCGGRTAECGGMPDRCSNRPRIPASRTGCRSGSRGCDVPLKIVAGDWASPVGC